MIKTSQLQLTHRDAGLPLTISELPALVADRYARRVLATVGAPVHGGVVSLALEHLPLVMKREDRAALLEPFVQTSRAILSWQNVLQVQQAALALHAGFLVGRPHIDIPVAMKSEAILRSGHGGDAVHWCSPHIATVLQSGHATYRELETVLSTEDVFNIVELVNVQSIREWRAHQQTRT